MAAEEIDPNTPAFSPASSSEEESSQENSTGAEVYHGIENSSHSGFGSVSNSTPFQISGLDDMLNIDDQPLCATSAPLKRTSQNWNAVAQECGKLRHSWRFGFIKAAGSWQPEFFGNEISTPVELWRHLNAISMPGYFGYDSIYVFKRGYTPQWESEEFATRDQAGRVNVTITDTRYNEVICNWCWYFTVCAIVGGGGFVLNYEDSIHGVVCNTKGAKSTGAIKIGLWIAVDTGDEAAQISQNYTREFLESYDLFKGTLFPELPLLSQINLPRIEFHAFRDRPRN